jgi:hypothetical protein
VDVTGSNLRDEKENIEKKEKKIEDDGDNDNDNDGTEKRQSQLK